MVKLRIPRTIEWNGREAIIIDQTYLPGRVKKLRIRTLAAMAEAIRKLRIRGAPAIGVAGAFGMVIGMRKRSPVNLKRRFDRARRTLAATRPTAVNLFWALDRMKKCFDQVYSVVTEGEVLGRLEQEAISIMQDDIDRCNRIGEYGAELLNDGDVVLTHCNAGAMATAGIGTALAVIYTAVQQGKNIRVYADETRPLLQGARITAWELASAGIDVTVITDGMAGWLMKTRKVNAVVVGTDRVAANGDVANKIGTYGVAVLARRHNVPFYVAAPLSTVDISLKTGKLIPIEERARAEVARPYGVTTVPAAVKVFNPAFDVTESRLVSAIITDRGIARAPYTSSLKRLLRC